MLNCIKDSSHNSVLDYENLCTLKFSITKQNPIQKN